ncbi:MAG: DUF2652 domain-containing protein [Ignavibacteriae bacterium]|nr:DUF2652 domain-containing protein [Ignavibacteriota bacterium]
MKSKTKSKTILLLADISGYTHFMRESPVASSHARQIIVRLLKSLIDASAPPLTVAELEGDAVFFYATTSDDEIARIAIEVKDQMLRLFASFRTEARKLAEMKACECDACSNVEGLRLKQILHVGDVATERVNQFNKLFGVDVILVHKLLKNSVPSDEYVLMTGQAHAVIMDFHGLTPRILREKVEEFGIVDTVVFYPVQSAKATATSNAHRPTLIDILVWKLRIIWNTLLVLVKAQSIKRAPSSARSG